MSETKPKAQVQLGPASLLQAEQCRVLYHVKVPIGTTHEDLLVPEFWAHVARKLRVSDRVEVESEDGTFYAEIRVQAVDKVWARMQTLRFVDLAGKPVPLSEKILQDYEVKFRGPHKWSVIRKSDAAVLQQSLHSEKEADDWLLKHLGG